jgi:hypothetical protein
MAWSTVSSVYICSMNVGIHLLDEEVPESDRAGDSPDVVDDGPRRGTPGDVDPDEHVDRLRVAPRFERR